MSRLVHVTTKEVTFRILSLTKKITGAPPKELLLGFRLWQTRLLGHHQRSYFLLLSPQRMCPASCLQNHKRNTVQCSGIIFDLYKPLLISYIKPQKLVNSQHYAHRMNKDLLGQAGVYTSGFKARSVRSGTATIGADFAKYSASTRPKFWYKILAVSLLSDIFYVFWKIFWITKTRWANQAPFCQFDE